MTAAELLAELTGQSFRLDICAEGIGVVPASQLTAAQIQAIRERKAELLVLLGAQASPVAQAPAPKRNQRKAGKRLAGRKAAGPNANRQQLSVNSKPTFPGSVPEVIHEAEQSPEKPSVAESVQIVLKAEASAAWIPPCPMCQW